MNTAIKRLLATVALLILAAGVFFYTKHKRATDNLREMPGESQGIGNGS